MLESQSLGAAMARSAPPPDGIPGAARRGAADGGRSRLRRRRLSGGRRPGTRGLRPGNRRRPAGGRAVRRAAALLPASGSRYTAKARRRPRRTRRDVRRMGCAAAGRGGGTAGRAGRRRPLRLHGASASSASGGRAGPTAGSRPARRLEETAARLRSVAADGGRPLLASASPAGPAHPVRPPAGAGRGGSRRRGKRCCRGWTRMSADSCSNSPCGTRRRSAATTPPCGTQPRPSAWSRRRRKFIWRIDFGDNIGRLREFAGRLAFAAGPAEPGRPIDVGAAGCEEEAARFAHPGWPTGAPAEAAELRTFLGDQLARWEGRLTSADQSLPARLVNGFLERLGAAARLDGRGLPAAVAHGGANPRLLSSPARLPPHGTTGARRPAGRWKPRRRPTRRSPRSATFC